MRPPLRRAALTVCVALLMVTAGCSSGTAPTATDDTTASGTGAPSTPVEQYPPGVASNGTLTNVSAILEAHFDATANESIALTRTWTGENESLVYRYAHGASPTPYYSSRNHTTDGDRHTQEFYWTGSHGYLRFTDDERTGYSVYQNSTPGVTAWTHERGEGPRSPLERQLWAGNYRVNGTVERDGRTFVRLTADENTPAMKGRYEGYEGTVLVTPEGIIHDVDSSYVQPITDDEPKPQIEESMTLETDVNWSGPPSWVATVPHLSISPVESGDALEIRNTGGAAVSANTSFTVSVRNETTWVTPSGSSAGTVTTDARLEPGDAVYLTAGRDGNPSSYALHDERVRGEYTIVAAGVFGQDENVSFHLKTGTKDG